ncbi:unnamed protein product [Tenebrio molitor]|jgi:hypothetical protein|nr:unnamed protein product [Tenebrio molitor]
MAYKLIKFIIFYLFITLCWNLPLERNDDVILNPEEFEKIARQFTTQHPPVNVSIISKYLFQAPCKPPLQLVGRKCSYIW